MRLNVLSVLALAGVLFMLTKDTFIPKGLRNNNPLNIRENQQTDFDWEGERVTNDDPAFEEFTSPVYGYRAAARILMSYERRGLVTVQQIISTWAPETENETDSYVQHVASRLGLFPDDVVGRDRWPQLMAVMTVHENGENPYSMETIQRGIALA